MIAHDIVLSRRAVLTGIAGLVIGIVLPEVASAQQSGAARAFASGTDAPAAGTPNAFIRVGLDDTVTVLIKHIETGQGCSAVSPINIRRRYP
jgi:isoquinoline 1-oxidoreductase subunit beta